VICNIDWRSHGDYPERGRWQAQVRRRRMKPRCRL